MHRRRDNRNTGIACRYRFTLIAVFSFTYVGTTGSKGYAKMIIYSVSNSDAYISVTDPASLRQIITALKNEGLIKRNCRYASYSLAYMAIAADHSGIAISKAGKIAFALWQAK